MSKTISTIIHANGDVAADFAGFGEKDCINEEERFRRELAGLGLTVEAKVRDRHRALEKSAGVENADFQRQQLR